MILLKPYFRIPLHDNKPFFLGMKDKVYDWESENIFKEKSKGRQKYLCPQGHECYKHSNKFIHCKKCIPDEGGTYYPLNHCGVKKAND